MTPAQTSPRVYLRPAHRAQTGAFEEAASAGGFMDAHSHLSSIKKVVWVCGSNREKRCGGKRSTNAQSRYQKKEGERDGPVKSSSFAKSRNLLPVTLRAATPIRAAAATPATATATLSSTLALAGRRWANKSVVDLNGLVEKFGSVEVLDGLSGLGKGRVFDQRVSLARRDVSFKCPRCSQDTVTPSPAGCTSCNYSC